MRWIRSLVVLLAASSVVACAHQKPPQAIEPPSPPVAQVAPAPPPAQAAPSPLADPAPTPVGIAPVSVYFPFDSAELTDETRAALQKLFDEVRTRPDMELRIEGNCDERGTAEYNVVLGLRRADTARRYLAGLGLDPTHITAISYGKERPRAAGHDAAAWQQNRRDDLVTTTKVASGASP